MTDGAAIHHKPHASNAACGSCFSLKTACFDKPSALAMTDRRSELGGKQREWSSSVTSSGEQSQDQFRSA
jgi:hypothetical protein